MFNVAYLALGGKTPSKFPRTKCRGAIFVLRGETCFRKRGRLSLYTDLQKTMELSLNNRNSVTTIFIILFSRLNLSFSRPSL